LAAEHDITYNVHLPMDIDPAAASTTVRRQSVERLAATIDRVAPLSPTTQTLHIAFDQPDQTRQTVKAWQQRAIDSLNGLLHLSGASPESISVENLDFSPHLLHPIVEALNTAVCIDVGHAVLFGFDLKATLDLYAPRITLIHLHGVAQGKDHRALTQLAPVHGQTVAAYLNGFQKSVSLEVFSLENLTASMACFADFMALGSSGDTRWQ
jgi:sugar phosphate isomerase/epimerase